MANRISTTSVTHPSANGQGQICAAAEDTTKESPELRAKMRLAGKLASLEVDLCKLQELRDAMNGAVRLVEHARHFHAKDVDDISTMASVYGDAFAVMAALAEASHWAIGDAIGDFATLRGDQAIGAELDRSHEHSPMGCVWTGEAYQDPYLK